MITQSITTKYVGPTNHRGSRVIAKTASGHKLTVNWQHELNVDENHIRAAKQLAKKLEWSGEWVVGSLDTGYCFVRVIKTHPDDSFTV